MRDIDGIDGILRVLRPHMAEIEEEFDRANEHFLNLFAIDHDPIGRVLRAHLIIENFLTTYLQGNLGVEEIATARLSFAQKVALLPNRAASAAFVKPGIKQLNKVRNQFGHKLEHEVDRSQIAAIYEVLTVARRHVEFNDPIEAIEAFAPVACAFLAMPNDHIRDIFARAFRRIDVADRLD